MIAGRWKDTWEHWYEFCRAKYAARRQLNGAVRKGLITKPNRCQDCGRILPLAMIQGHHEHYDRPLAVFWVCARCHGRYHTEAYMREHFAELRGQAQ